MILNDYSIIINNIKQYIDVSVNIKTLVNIGLYISLLMSATFKYASGAQRFNASHMV